MQSAIQNHPITVQAALDTLPADTPQLLAVRQAASEMPAPQSLSLPSGQEELAEQFAMWRQVEEGSLLEPLLQVCPDPGSLPCRMAAVLAAVPSPMPYHNHHHTREVVCLAMLLASELSVAHKSELYIAACIHDFAHDGMGNRRGNAHTPMRLERRALEMAAPYLQAAGLSAQSWKNITVMVLATDVSKHDSDAISPAEWMRKAYAGDKPDGCPPELKNLFADADLAHHAALLEDADLGTSGAMPYDFAKRMTALIAEETRVLSPTPQTLIGFIDHICHGAFITPEARALFGDNMASLRREADEETADTIYKWS